MTANVLADITEYDAETFKELVNGNVDDDMFTWTFESEEGVTVNITFRKEPEEDDEEV